MFSIPTSTRWKFWYRCNCRYTERDQLKVISLVSYSAELLCRDAETYPSERKRINEKEHTALRHVYQPGYSVPTTLYLYVSIIRIGSQKTVNNENDAEGYAETA